MRPLAGVSTVSPSCTKGSADDFHRVVLTVRNRRNPSALGCLAHGSVPVASRAHASRDARGAHALVPGTAHDQAGLPRPCHLHGGRDGRRHRAGIDERPPRTATGVVGARPRGHPDHRGAIFGALGARLGTGILTGEYTTELRRGTFTAQNVEASILLTFVSSALGAVAARATAAAFGLQTITVWELMVVSMVGGLLSSGFILVGVLLLSSKAHRRGWNMDAIGSPLITATGDIVTLPALVVATFLLVDPTISAIVGVGFLALIVGSTRRKVATTSAGRVTMSPVAVISGEPMASMFHPRRWALLLSSSTPTRMNPLESRPPTMDTTISSHTVMVCRPKAAAVARAATAPSAEDTKVSRIEASTFCAVKVPRRSSVVYSPVRMPVPSRAPNAPKMAPRIPMAAGTSTNNPGSCSRRPFIDPSTMPAAIPTTVEMARARKPCLIVRRSWDQCVSPSRITGRVCAGSDRDRAMSQAA